MNIDIVSIISAIIAFIIGIIILKIDDVLDYKPLYVIVLTISALAGITPYIIVEGPNEKIINVSMANVENYIENSTEEQDSNVIEKEIKNIIRETSDKVKDVNVSSYTNEKSQTRLIEIDMSVGKKIYTEYNYKYAINLKTKKIKEVE